MPDPTEIVPLEVLREAREDLDPTRDPQEAFFECLNTLARGFLDVAIEAIEEEQDDGRSD